MDVLTRVVTLAVTNVIKLAGLYIGVREITVNQSTDAAVLALSAFMMAGAQLSETAVLGLADRMFGPRNGKDK